MGLLSDYLERNRETLSVNEIDPCLYIKFTGVNSNLHKSINFIHKNSNLLDEKDLVAQLFELEKLKTLYLVAEKIVLKFIKDCEIKSHLISEITDFFLCELQQSYKSTCKIINESNMKAKIETTPNILIDSDDTIKRDILNSIINSCIQCLKSGTLIDTSECRKVVNDLASAICHFTNESLSFSKKQILSYYLENELKFPKSNHQCSNCHKQLLFNLPYCFNCYERNI